MTSEQFKLQLLEIFYQDMHRTEKDNYDAFRFGYDGVDRSTLFDASRRARFMSWFNTNIEAIFRTFSHLADQRSRDLYVDILRFKLAGHLHVRINNHIAALAPQVEAFKAAASARPSSAAVGGVFGNLVEYNVDWQGNRYDVHTIQDGLVATLVYRQYFFERDGVRIAPQAGDFVIDGGSCTGDTVAVFREAVGPSGHVYAFDPVQVHVDLCKLNTSRDDYRNTTVFPYGVGERSIDAPMISLTHYHPGYHPSNNEEPVPLRRIDDLVIDGKIERVDFLKLDIEGAEMSALRGAEAAIRRFRPKLAISIYHQPNDFFEIADFIWNLGMGYRLYLDHYTIHEEETVLYAMV
jgi:FkbM family methyltransferase